MEVFLMWFGAFASLLTVTLFFYGVGKWVIAKLRHRTDSASRGTVTVVNWITTGLERTVVVPYMVEKVVEKVVPVVAPSSPTKPTRPIPEWLEPDRPRPHRPEPPEIRPAFRPRRPSWFPDKDSEPNWFPDREPGGRPYTHTRPGPPSFHRPGGESPETGHGHPGGPRHGSDAGDFFGGGSRPGSSPFDIRGGRGGDPFGRGSDD